MNNTDTNTVIFGQPQWDWFKVIWYILVLVFSWFMLGEFTTYIFISLSVVISIVGYPFRRIVEVSPDEIVIRRNYRKLGRVRAYKMKDIQEVGTRATRRFQLKFGRNEPALLALHFKDGTKEKIFLPWQMDVQAIKGEMGKYVDTITVGFWYY